MISHKNCKYLLATHSSGRKIFPFHFEKYSQKKVTPICSIHSHSVVKIMLPINSPVYQLLKTRRTLPPGMHQSPSRMIRCCGAYTYVPHASCYNSPRTKRNINDARCWNHIVNQETTINNNRSYSIIFVKQAELCSVIGKIIVLKLIYSYWKTQNK